MDPYFYPGTDVLRNKLGIRDNEDLRAAETRIGLFALERLKTRPLVLPFTVERLEATHEAIFRDIYEWAGQLRKNTGTMTKGRAAGYTITYGNSDFVPQELDRIFENLRRDNYLRGLAPSAFAEKIAWHYAQIDGTHPFRDGNSRALRQFTADLANQAGYNLDWTTASATEQKRQAIYLARDYAYLRGDLSGLKKIILENLTSLPAATR